MSTSNGYDNILLVVPRLSSGQNPHVPVLVRHTIPKLLPKNHVLVRVDRFGFSSNNVTYQALGEQPHFRYFDFHYAPESPDVYGVIPVWGFATVIASTVAKIRVSERVFGYLAMARYLLLPVDVADINDFNFYIPRPHLPKDRRPYNQLTRCSHDLLYQSTQEDFAMIYRPLFWTSFWAEDWLFSAPNSPYSGATKILISSASSKTAFCLAYLIQKRAHGVTVVGLTSEKNCTFTEGLGLYNLVITYGGVERGLSQVGATGLWVYIDVAGNDALNVGIRKVLGDHAVRNVSLGMTNLSPAVSGTYVMPSSGVTGSSLASMSTSCTPVFEFFFMPEWLSERRRGIGTQVIFKMQHVAWNAFMRDCTVWTTVQRTWGPKNVIDAYGDMIGGHIGSDKAMVWSLWEVQQGAEWEKEVICRADAKGKL